MRLLNTNHVERVAVERDKFDKERGCEQCLGLSTPAQIVPDTHALEEFQDNESEFELKEDNTVICIPKVKPGPARTARHNLNYSRMFGYEAEPASVVSLLQLDDTFLGSVDVNSSNFNSSPATKCI